MSYTSLLSGDFYINNVSIYIWEESKQSRKIRASVRLLCQLLRAISIMKLCARNIVHIVHVKVAVRVRELERTDARNRQNLRE